MLLCGELLEQVLVGGVWGLLTLGQPVTQPVLMGKEQPHLPPPTFGNTCTQRWRQQMARSECHRIKGTPIHVFTTCVSHLHTHKILHTYTSFTLAESVIHLILVLWDCRSARGCQFSLPQCQRIFGALAHFLVAQLHLADVQLISARCNTIARTKKRWKNIFSIILSVKILWSLRENQHQWPPKDGCTSKQKKPPAFVEQQRGGLKCIGFESKCVYSPSHLFVTSYHRKPST